MQFTWGLDSFPPRTRGVANVPIPGVQQFMRNVLADMSRPAAPLELTATSRASGRLRLEIAKPPDPRITRTIVRRDGTVICDTTATSCIDTNLPGHRWYRYSALSADEWGESAERTFGPFWLLNSKPEVVLRGPQRVTVEARARYHAAALDPDGDPLTFRWRIDGRPLGARADRAVVTLRRAGRHVLTVEVSDGYGGRASASLRVVAARRSAS
jgi:hypothetical protein